MMRKRQSYKERIENYSKESLFNEYDKKMKSYQYQSGNIHQLNDIIAGTSTFTTSNPEKQLEKHLKSAHKLEKEMNIIKEIVCRKYQIGCEK